MNNREKCPGDGVLGRLYRPGGGGFELLFCPGGGEFAHKKIAQGGWSGLELTDTLVRPPGLNSPHFKLFKTL